MGVIAHAGEIIRDQNGAVVATVARDICRGQWIGSVELTLADGRRLIRGEQYPLAVWDFLRGRGA